MVWASILSGLSTAGTWLTKFWSSYGSTILNIGTKAYGFYQGYKDRKAQTRATEAAAGREVPPSLRTYGQYPGAAEYLSRYERAPGERVVERPGYPLSLLETKGLAQRVGQRPTPTAQDLAGWATAAYDEATRASILKALPEIEKLIGPKMVYHGGAPAQAMTQLMEKYIPYKERAATIAQAPQLAEAMEMKKQALMGELWSKYQAGDIDFQKLKVESDKLNELFSNQMRQLGLQARGEAGVGMAGWSPQYVPMPGTELGKTLGASDIAQWAGLLKGFGGTLKDLLGGWGDSVDYSYGEPDVAESIDDWDYM